MYISEILIPHWVIRCDIFVKFFPPPWCNIYSPFPSSWRDWEWQLGGGWAGVILSLPSSTRTACSRCCCLLAVGSHGGVVLGKAAASLPGGSCWQRQLWLCVFSKSPCPFQLPFLPLHKRSSPVLIPEPDGLHPGSNPCFSQSWKFIWACVHSAKLCVCRPNQTGQHRCDRLTGMLGMWRRWSGCVHPWPGAKEEGLPQYRQTAQLCFAGWLPDWLIG